MELIDVEKLIVMLDRDSEDRYGRAITNIKKVLKLEQDILDVLYNKDWNFWEWITKEYRFEGYDRQRFIAHLLLINEVKKIGIIKPVLITKKHSGRVILQNGYHRLAIAKVLGIKEIKTEIYVRKQA